MKKETQDKISDAILGLVILLPVYFTLALIIAHSF